MGMTMKRITHPRMDAILVVCSLIFLATAAPTSARSLSWVDLALKGGPAGTYERPPHTEYAAMARWLMANNNWGVLSTLSVHLKGRPFGNLQSFSDGPASAATGRPFFYMTPFDVSSEDLRANATCSLTVTEETVGTCVGIDPERPTCARVTISGQMVAVPAEDIPLAQESIFARHPEMKKWPKDHHWEFFELQIEDIFLLDFFGGAIDVPIKDYFGVKLVDAQ